MLRTSLDKATGVAAPHTQGGARFDLQDLRRLLHDAQQQTVDVILQRLVLIPELSIVVLQICRPGGRGEGGEPGAGEGVSQLA